MCDLSATRVQVANLSPHLWEDYVTQRNKTQMRNLCNHSFNHTVPRQQTNLTYCNYAVVLSHRMDFEVIEENSYLKLQLLPSAAEWLPAPLWCGAWVGPYLWSPVPEQPLSFAAGSPSAPSHGPLCQECCSPSSETVPVASHAGTPTDIMTDVVNSNHY